MYQHCDIRKQKARQREEQQNKQGDRHGPLTITTRKNTTPVPAIAIWGRVEVPSNNGGLALQYLCVDYFYNFIQASAGSSLLEGENGLILWYL